MSTSVSKETAQRLKDFNKRVATTAEDIVFRVFPEKILELQLVIDSTESKISPFHSSHAVGFTDVTVYPPPSSPEEPEIKKRRLTSDGDPTGVVVNDTQFARYPNIVHANAHTVKLHDIIKKECEELAELCDKIKLWINLTMPKMEDGDNLGVQIQEEVLTELLRSQESAYNLRDGARQDYINRAKICSKIIKYPYIEDYALALKEHDDKQLYMARQHLADIRNVYAVITDIIHKNITKIRSPKANNGIGLY